MKRPYLKEDDMKFLSLRKTALTFLPALLIAGGLVFTSPSKPVFAQERNDVAWGEDLLENVVTPGGLK